MMSIRICCILCACPLLYGLDQADMRAIVEQVLDSPVELKLENVPINRAFDVIADSTAVRINMPPDVMALLPYGSDTRVNVELRNVTLRDGLEQLFAPLGMDFDVTDRGVDVFPGPGLARLGRSAKWSELGTIQWLESTPLTDGVALELLHQRIQFRVPDPDPWSMLAGAIKKVGAGSAAELLEVAADSLGWTWYPWDEHIVVLPWAEQAKRQLDRLITVRKTHRPLVEVLQTVGREVGVPVRLAPGAAESLPPEVRSTFTLLAENVTASEALEQIAATSGLSYRIDEGGVVFEQPSAARGPDRTRPGGAVRRTRDAYVAKITVPDPSGIYQIELLVRESDLSPEVNALRQQMLDEANDVIEKALRDHLTKRASEKRSPNSEL